MGTVAGDSQRRSLTVGFALTLLAASSAAIAVTALTAVVLQAGLVVVAGPPMPSEVLLAVGAISLAVARIAVRLRARLSMSEPSRTVTVRYAAAMGALIAVITFAPDARNPLALGRLQVPLIVAGLFYASSASRWVPRVLGWLERTRPTTRLAALFRHGVDFVRREQPVVVLLLISFLARFLLADWNSYWYDELLSVRVYGGWHASATEAIQALADGSVHPPLYQFILFNWMTLFSDSELATRTLSNLYITIATLFMYLLMKDWFGRRVAILTAIAFVCLYSTMYYGLETRSYAQTILLAVLSSYLALRLIQRQPHRSEPTQTPRALVGALIATNAALLLTHYYNLYFLVAQAALIGLYEVRRHSFRHGLRRLGAVAAVYSASVAIFLVLWGRVLFGRYSSLASSFEVGEEGVLSPTRLLFGSVIQINLRVGPILLTVIGLATAAVVARALRDIGRRVPSDASSWGIVALATWLALPVVFTYLAFATLGVERYSNRYFVFSAAPVAALLVIAVDRLTAAAVRGASRIRPLAKRSTWSTLAVGLAIALYLVPGGHAAATTQKQNWRNITTAVVNIERSDPESKYILFETSHRLRPMSDYYFERLGAGSRPYATVLRREERSGTYRILTDQSAVIAEHDYLVLLFLHSTTAHYPVLLSELDLRYETHLRQLDRQGRGFIIYRIASEQP